MAQPPLSARRAERPASALRLLAALLLSLVCAAAAAGALRDVTILLPGPLPGRTPRAAPRDVGTAGRKAATAGGTEAGSAAMTAAAGTAPGPKHHAQILQRPSASCSVLPPLPVLPVPSARQLAWQERELLMFFHFGVNTYTGREWGDGTEEPVIFKPDRLNASQWIEVAKSGGFKGVVLTAKHHDGFCLWPSDLTNHSVQSSVEWRGGEGDAVDEVARAAHVAGLALGVYLSPWDQHEPSYHAPKPDKYNAFYLGQMRELLTRYGRVSEWWLDGANGEGVWPAYDTRRWFATLRQLQPHAAIFSGLGPDLRWVGNEDGMAPETLWSTFNLSESTFDGSRMPALAHGDPDGPDWVPAECDVSIRDGWFWHAAQQPKSLSSLLSIYLRTVGRGCTLLLNVPPNRSGLIDDADALRVEEFGDALRSIFSVDAAANAAAVTASSTHGGDGDGDGGDGGFEDNGGDGPKLNNVPSRSKDKEKPVACAQYRPSNVIMPGTGSFWAAAEDDEDRSLTLEFSAPVSFDLVLLQEAIAFGQRVAEFEVWVQEEEVKGRGSAPSLQEGDGAGEASWRLIGRGTTIGYKRILQTGSTIARAVKLYVLEARAAPLIVRVGLFDSQSTIPESLVQGPSGGPCLEIRDRQRCEGPFGRRCGGGKQSLHAHQ